MNANEKLMIEKVRAEKEALRLAAIEADRANPEPETDPWACVGDAS